MTPGRINVFVLHYPDEIIHMKSVLQEEQCLHVPQVFLYITVQNRNEHIQKCTSELVFSLAQVAISDWEARKMTKVVVPAALRARRSIMEYLEMSSIFR
jgi:hypothetical protein